MYVYIYIHSRIYIYIYIYRYIHIATSMYKKQKQSIFKYMGPGGLQTCRSRLFFFQVVAESDTGYLTVRPGDTVTVLYLGEEGEEKGTPGRIESVWREGHFFSFFSSSFYYIYIYIFDGKGSHRENRDPWAGWGTLGCFFREATGQTARSVAFFWSQILRHICFVCFVCGLSKFRSQP